MTREDIHMLELGSSHHIHRELGLGSFGANKVKYNVRTEWKFCKQNS